MAEGFDARGRLVDCFMATRISDETAARIEKAWPDLLDQLAAGEVMAPHYARHAVSADQVRVWRVREQGRSVEWDAAREQSAEAYADQVAEIINKPGADSGIARVKIDGLKWLASKRNPRGYSDRVDHNVTVRTIDLTRIIEAANARLASARVIEAEVLAPKLENLL